MEAWWWGMGPYERGHGHTYIGEHPWSWVYACMRVYGVGFFWDIQMHRVNKQPMSKVVKYN